MIIKLFASYSDGQDGSFSIALHNTREEALERLGRTEEELKKGCFYEDGAIEPLELEIDSSGKLMNNVSISVGD